MFFKTFAKALKLKDVRRKLFNIFIALLVYRLGAHIYLPALNLKLINLFKAASKQSLFAIISSRNWSVYNRVDNFTVVNSCDSKFGAIKKRW